MSKGLYRRSQGGGKKGHGSQGKLRERVERSIIYGRNTKRQKNITSIQVIKDNNIDMFSHEYKFQKTRARLDTRKYSFSSRVVNEWNNLSMEAVQSTTLNCFKKHVDRHLNSG